MHCVHFAFGRLLAIGLWDVHANSTYAYSFHVLLVLLLLSQMSPMRMLVPLNLRLAIIA